MWARIIWCVLLLLAVGAMSLHLWYLFDQYFQYPIITKISLGYASLRFPQVTLCNTNIIHKGKFDAFDRAPDLKELVREMEPINLAPDMYDPNWDPYMTTVTTPPQGSNPTPQDGPSTPHPQGSTPPPQQPQKVSNLKTIKGNCCDIGLNFFFNTLNKKDGHISSFICLETLLLYLFYTVTVSAFILIIENDALHNIFRKSFLVPNFQRKKRFINNYGKIDPTKFEPDANNDPRHEKPPQEYEEFDGEYSTEEVLGEVFEELYMDIDK